MLEVLAILIGMEQAARQQRALQRRLRLARLPKPKTVTEYDFHFPKRIPKAAILRLFDCDFIPEHGCAVVDRAHGDRKDASSHGARLPGGGAWLTRSSTRAWWTCSII